MADARFSPEDKAALDIWYIMNASLWLDIKILLRTLAIVVSGDRVNEQAVNAAHARLEEMRTKPPSKLHVCIHQTRAFCARQEAA